MIGESRGKTEVATMVYFQEKLPGYLCDKQVKGVIQSFKKFKAS